jgi:hypothetical protein
MAFYTIVSLIIIGVVLIWWARLGRWLRRRKNQLDDAERCRCGYNLRDLTMARCPECGRVVGFDATAEELTLTKEELERAATVREQRRKAAKQRD